MIVYLNANFLIYFIEMNPVWGPKVTAYITRCLPTATNWPSAILRGWSVKSVR